MMKRFLVKRVVEFSKVIEAATKEKAIDEFGDLDADMKTLKETATEIKDSKVLSDRIVNNPRPNHQEDW